MTRRCSCNRSSISSEGASLSNSEVALAARSSGLLCISIHPVLPAARGKRGSAVVPGTTSLPEGLVLTRASLGGPILAQVVRIQVIVSRWVDEGWPSISRVEFSGRSKCGTSDARESPRDFGLLFLAPAVSLRNDLRRGWHFSRSADLPQACRRLSSCSLRRISTSSSPSCGSG